MEQKDCCVFLATTIQLLLSTFHPHDYMATCSSDTWIQPKTKETPSEETKFRQEAGRAPARVLVPQIKVFFIGDYHHSPPSHPKVKPANHLTSQTQSSVPAFLVKVGASREWGKLEEKLEETHSSYLR